MLYDSCVKSGNWLFVRRGELPIVLIVLSMVVVFADRWAILWSMHEWYSAVCLFISLIGLAIRCIAVGTSSKNTSGRNTKEGQVADTLNTTGIYSLMRHPLYVGNFFMWLGICASTGSVWYTLFFIPLYFLYYERIIMAEEDFLYKKFGEPYRQWSEGTNAVIPSFKNYKSSTNSFSMKTVIRREYHGILYMTLSFVLIDILKKVAFGDLPIPGQFWIIFGSITLVYCLIVRILAKKTKVLHVENRS